MPYKCKNCLKSEVSSKQYIYIYITNYKLEYLKSCRCLQEKKLKSN